MNRVIKKKISNNINLYIIDIHQIDDKLKELLDKRIAMICEGNSGSSNEIVKKRISKFLKKKKSETFYGAIAEFFIHLFVTNIGYKQECMFFNLEENSIKKGFDGYYSLGLEEWIMESKSGFSKGVTHKLKINKAYNDLVKKVSGDIDNNPWRNAYNHASHKDIDTKESILNHIKTLTDDFENEKYYEIMDFNIIPASTIYLEETGIKIISENTERDIKGYFEGIEVKKAVVFCVTQKSAQLFLDYLAL